MHLIIKSLKPGNLLRVAEVSVLPEAQEILGRERVTIDDLLALPKLDCETPGKLGIHAPTAPIAFFPLE